MLCVGYCVAIWDCQRSMNQWLGSVLWSVPVLKLTVKKYKGDFSRAIPDPIFHLFPIYRSLSRSHRLVCRSRRPFAAKGPIPLIRKMKQKKNKKQTEPCALCAVCSGDFAVRGDGFCRSRVSHTARIYCEGALSVYVPVLFQFSTLCYLTEIPQSACGPDAARVPSTDSPEPTGPCMSARPCACVRVCAR